MVDGGPPVSLSFERDLYTAEVSENPESGRDVTQVQAFRSDGRLQKVIYTFVKGALALQCRLLLILVKVDVAS